MLLIFCSYALCASTFTLAKAALSYAKPFFFVGFRMTVAGILLLTYEYVRKGSWVQPIASQDRTLFMRIMLFHIYGAYMAEMWAQQYLASYQTAFLYNLSPIMTALFSYWWWGERLTKVQLGGLVLGLCGILISSRLPGDCCVAWVPVLVMWSAVLCSVWGWMTMKVLVQRNKYSPIFINGVGMVSGGILALLTSALCEPWAQGTLVTAWTPFICLTALVILFANIIFYNAYSFLLKRYSATLLSFAGLSVPFFAALFGVIFLSEPLSFSCLMSMIVVSGGLYLFYKEEFRYTSLPKKI